MKFKIDENLPGEVCATLQGLGHEADTVTAEGLSGAADPAVMEAARQENRVLFTLDKGIGNVARYPRGSHAGVVLFRPGAAGQKTVAAFIGSRLETLLKLDLREHITVVTPTRIRLR